MKYTLMPITSGKTEVIKINVSSSFLPRARCKVCGEGPTWYYYTRKPSLQFDIRAYKDASKFWRSWIRRASSDWYLDMQPRYFKDNEEFKLRLSDINYRPLLHRTRGSHVTSGDNVIEMVSCDCGSTTWAFNNKSVKNRPEITNRKGRSHYSKKFTY